MKDIIVGSEQEEQIVGDILGKALYASDELEFYDSATKYSQCNNFNILGIIFLSFGHISRLHNKLDLDKTKEIFTNSFNSIENYNFSEQEEKFILSQLSTGLSDVKFFLGKNILMKLYDMVPKKWIDEILPE